MLIKEALSILSKANEKIASLGVDYVDQEGSPKQPRTLQQLIRVRQLYNLINKFVFLNVDGSAITGTFGQNDAAINRLLLVLKRCAKIESIPVIPNPIHSFITQSCCGGSSSLPLNGDEGDLLYFHNGSWTPFAKGSDGEVLTSTPTGIVWSSAVGNGIPSGGLQNQFLKKNSNTSYDTIWSAIATTDITGLTSNSSELNILTGAIISTTELNYLFGLSEPLSNSLSAKLSTSLADGKFIVGNSSNIATARTPSGDVIFDDLGVFAISNGAIIDSDINASAAISRSKIAAGTMNRIVVNDATTGFLNDAAAIDANRLLISDANGIPTASVIDASIVPFLDPTSSIQTQFDGKLSATLTTPAQGDILIYNGSTYVNYAIGTNGYVLTSDGTSAIWSPATANGLPAGGTTHQYLRKASNTNYDVEWETLLFADINDVSTTALEINLLSGLSTDAAHLNFTSNVTMDIQSQIDNKQSKSLAYNAIWVGNAGNVAAELSPGNDTYVLTMVGTTPQWHPQTPPGNVSGVAPSTDNAIVRWNSTSADSIQNSGIIIDDSNNVTFPNGVGLRTGISSGNTLLLQAYDVDGAAYTTFVTLTAGNTPTMDLNSAVTISSSYIYRAGGTDISLSDGGTGSSLSDPGANKILAWDDTDNSIGFWAISGGLSYDHSTHTLSGLSNSAANTELMMSDGTNAVSSKIFVPSVANLVLGDGTTTGPYTIGTAGTSSRLIIDNNANTLTLKGEAISLQAGTGSSSGAPYFTINKRTSSFPTSTTGAIAIWSQDSSLGSSNGTLALLTQQAVETSGGYSYLRSWVNGTEYWIPLTTPGSGIASPGYQGDWSFVAHSNADPTWSAGQYGYTSDGRGAPGDSDYVPPNAFIIVLGTTIKYI